MTGHPLAWIREHNNWSQDDLARLIRHAARRRNRRSGADRNRIWQWETQGVEPTSDSQRLLADVLAVPHSAVDGLGWPWWLPAYCTPHAFDPAGSRAALTEILVTRMDRRAFLVLSSAALVGVAQQWAQVEPGHLLGALGGRRVDEGLLVWLEDRAVELRALANSSGPAVAGLVEAHLHTTVELIDQGHYAQAAGQRLHAVTATLAQCAGWTHFDAGRHAAAQRHWQAALHAAHQAGDRDTGAGVLSDLAYQATWLARPEDAVQILDHARSRAGSPAARSLLDLRKARALAVLQDSAGVGRALGSAETELGRARPENTPGWVSWMSPADLAADAGRCWLDLGRVGRAQQAIGEGLDLLDPARSRTRAVFLTYRAEGHVRAGDVVAGAAHARAAVDAAAEARAPRCTDLVRELVASTSRYQSVGEVRDLQEYARLRLAA